MNHSAPNSPVRSDDDIDAVRLVPIRAEHAARWREWREQASSQRFNPLLHFSVEQLTRRILTTCTSDLADRTRSEYRWVVEFRGELIGTVATEQPSWRMGYAEIGYMMSETHHGRGFGTRAVALFVEKLFRETELHRLFASIAYDNIASRRLIERLGFVREGRLRQHYVIQNRRVDEIVYGLLRHEYQGTHEED